MTPSEYLNHDATSLAAMVAQGKTSAAELLALAEQRAHLLNPQVNAICRLMPDQARQQLAAPLHGLLAGLPILIKDAIHDYAGVPSSYGSRAKVAALAQQHSHVVQRLLDAGAVIFGKTNTSELTLLSNADSPAFGRTRNPWNLDRVPGGSSGGSAAAVAAGIVPMATGTDGGGSIRIPAACCGLFGLRPSRGRIPAGPGMGEVWDGASSDGVLSRSVRDTALALEVLSGAAPGAPFVVERPQQSYVELAQGKLRRLRIGYTHRSPIDTPVHLEAVAAVENAARLLTSLGHSVEQAAPRYDGQALAYSFLHMYFDHASAAIQLAKRQGAAESEFALLTRILGAFGRAKSAQSSTLERLNRNAFSQALAAFHQRYDLLLTPTLAAPPVVHGHGDIPAWQQPILRVLLNSGMFDVLARTGALDGSIRAMACDSLGAVPFTQLANLTGTPAMSVPLHWSADGLPLGVQFVAPFGDEVTLLQLATELEQAQPWFNRLPAMARAGL
ncbi:MAG: amidase [Pseudomonadota bacterium]